MMFKAALVFAIFGFALADQSYGYDQQAYARDGGHHSSPSSSGYGAPPATGYGAPPSSGYGEPTGYADSYAVADEGGDFDIGATLSELLPIFLAVFAAIILASLLAPLLVQLLALLVGLLPMALGIKAPIVNALLAPFNLVLAEFPAGGDAATGPLTVFDGMKRSFDGRSLANGFGLDLSDDQIDILSNFATKALGALSEKYNV
jgi:hypothetical protein